MNAVTKHNLPRLALIGFGEAAGAFAEGWRDLSLEVKAFDIKMDRVDVRQDVLGRCADLGVTACDDHASAVQNADLVFSFVTADQALEAAQSAAPAMAESGLYFDCNSCAPNTKREAARIIEAAGGRYVDAAVMAPVYPNLHRTPVTLSGPHTAAAADIAAALKMNISVEEGDVGTASSIKMVRSIMMKGLEALMLECVLAGRKAGVEDRVFASLDKTYPGFDFAEKAAYMQERVMVHGKRRAAEMREVALTIEQLGLPNFMTGQTVIWQQMVGDMELDPDHSLASTDYGPRADALLAVLAKDDG